MLFGNAISSGPQIFDRFLDDAGGHPLGALAYGGRGNIVFPDDGKRIDPTRFLVNVPKPHAAGVTAVDAVDRGPGMQFLDVSQDTVETFPVVQIRKVEDFDAIGETDILKRGSGQSQPHVVFVKSISGRKIVLPPIRGRGLLIDAHSRLLLCDHDLTRGQSARVKLRDESEMHVHLFQTALIQRTPNVAQMRIVDGIEGTEEYADATVRRDARTNIARDAVQEMHEEDRHAEEQCRLSAGNLPCDQSTHTAADGEAQQDIVQSVSGAAKVQADADRFEALCRQQQRESGESDA